MKIKCNFSRFMCHNIYMRINNYSRLIYQAVSCVSSWLLGYLVKFQNNVINMPFSIRFFFWLDLWLPCAGGACYFASSFGEVEFPFYTGGYSASSNISFSPGWARIGKRMGCEDNSIWRVQKSEFPMVVLVFSFDGVDWSH